MAPRSGPRDAKLPLCFQCTFGVLRHPPLVERCGLLLRSTEFQIMLLECEFQRIREGPSGRHDGRLRSGWRRSACCRGGATVALVVARHEQQSVAEALAAALHHCRDVEPLTNSAPRCWEAASATVDTMFFQMFDEEDTGVCVRRVRECVAGVGVVPRAGSAGLAARGPVLWFWNGAARSGPMGAVLGSAMEPVVDVLSLPHIVQHNEGRGDPFMLNMFVPCLCSDGEPLDGQFGDDGVLLSNG